MRDSGPVVPVRGGDAPRRFRALLRVAVPAARDGLVWFAEDDYLYLPGGLRALRAAADAVPAAEYLGLYTPDNTAWHREHREPAGTQGSGAGLRRRRHDLAARLGQHDDVRPAGAALRRDARLLALCSRTGGPWDNTTVTAVQGVAPYAWPRLYGDLHLRPTRASAGRVLGRPVLRGLANLAALGARSDRGCAPERSLATHLEQGHLAAGTDRATVAGQV